MSHGSRENRLRLGLEVSCLFSGLGWNMELQGCTGLSLSCMELWANIRLFVYVGRMKIWWREAGKSVASDNDRSNIWKAFIWAHFKMYWMTVKHQLNKNYALWKCASQQLNTLVRPQVLGVLLSIIILNQHLQPIQWAQLISQELRSHKPSISNRSVSSRD